MVPPDAVEPLLKQLVNQFVHDRARTEVIAVGLNVVREICIRMPLLMTEDLLRDLTLYKKSHEKAVSSAARSLIGIFRQICPSLLDKKDRGRAADTKARPKAFGEKDVVSNVPGAELLLVNEGSSSDSGSDDEDAADADTLDVSNESGEEGTADHSEDTSDSGKDFDIDDQEESCEEEEEYSDPDEEVGVPQEEISVEESTSDEVSDSDEEVEASPLQTATKKRKLDELNTGKDMSLQSLRALKKIALDKVVKSGLINSVGQDDGILSNEDFKRIRELQAKNAAKIALSEHGMVKAGSSAKAVSIKIPNSEHLSERRVDPAKLEANIHTRKDKEERLALVKAGREDRMKYASRTAVKQKKTGGLSNRQKERKKGMPLAAKRSKVARSRIEKKKRTASKRFLGKKAWK